jgi:hypothetical protein
LQFLYPLATKIEICHSERSEESCPSRMILGIQILRFAQNDKVDLVCGNRHDVLIELVICYT